MMRLNRLGLGLDYLDKYRKAVAAVTPEDVQEVAKKTYRIRIGYIDRGRRSVADGKVIGKEPGAKD